MPVTEIRDAQSQLSRLVERALDGEEVLIGEAGAALVRLVPVVEERRPPRVGGQWRGRVRIGEDFDVLPDDLADALGLGPR
jgi:antitoxin (DNA-binding transcriptional repressor) of toxin-antitoxin stability system